MFDSLLVIIIVIIIMYFIEDILSRLTANGASVDSMYYAKLVSVYAVSNMPKLWKLIDEMNAKGLVGMW